MNKPVFLFDLDDTLFQTRRKMTSEQGLAPYRVGALDRSLAPRSFMTQEQAMLTDWLLAHAELIPVTARGTEETGRVKIPFNSWRITTHGAVIVAPDGAPDPEWRHTMLARLDQYRDRLFDMERRINTMMAERGLHAWCRINYEYDGTPVYLVMKHRDSTRAAELHAFQAQLVNILSCDGFYIHQNGNNVAWLPVCVEKGLATRYLLDKLRRERGPFPVLGFGDSLSDYGFMRHCHWFGMPAHSQFAAAIDPILFRTDTFRRDENA